MNRYDDFNEPDERVGCRGIIVSLFAVAMLWLALFICVKAYGNSEPEPVKDWCYSHVSGQSMPMDYCD